MPDLIRNLENYRDDIRALTRYRKRIGNYQLLILYDLFEQRCGTNPTIFVGQYPVDEWHNRLGGGPQADSIMDRIVYNAYEIPTSETNLRKIYDTKRLKKLVDTMEK